LASDQQTYESMRVAEALRSLPVLTAAFKEGKTFWAGVREITRIAKPATEEAWLRWSEGKNCREITFGVQDAREHGSDLPRERSGGLPNLVTRCAFPPQSPRGDADFSLTLEENEIIETAFAKAAAEMQVDRIRPEEELPSDPQEKIRRPIDRKNTAPWSKKCSTATDSAVRTAARSSISRPTTGRSGRREDAPISPMRMGYANYVTL
jgi:hypothetical protein